MGGVDDVVQGNRFRKHVQCLSQDKLPTWHVRQISNQEQISPMSHQQKHVPNRRSWDSWTDDLIANAMCSGLKRPASCSAVRLTTRDRNRCLLRRTCSDGAFRSQTIPSQDKTTRTYQVTSISHQRKPCRA